MKNEEWFRRTSWSPDAEREFFERLNRARAQNKAQYLRIQALHLAEAGRANEALKLLNRLFVDFPDLVQLAMAHHQAARCHEHLGNIDEAIREYRLALEVQNRVPNVDPGTRLEFPWLVAMRRLQPLYDEALSILDSAHIAFPIQAFKAAAIRAFIAHARQSEAQASRHAAEALRAAGLEESQFRHHRALGLVGPEYEHVIEQLADFAAA